MTLRGAEAAGSGTASRAAPRFVRWAAEGWRGWLDATAQIDPAACLRAAESEAGRASRHARTTRLPTSAGVLFVKSYPAPGGWRATRAFRMGRELVARGFGAPEVVIAAARGQAGLLVTRDAGGEDLASALARCAGKRALLRALGAEVARLHRAGFVHGDLVPPNVRVRGTELVFLDNDRTRRGRFLVWLVGRRNLVQLGRLVVRGVTATDRARVLVAYGAGRGFSRSARHRLGRWVVRKTIARRCAIDHIAPETAARIGFRELMRSGGPFDPASAGTGPA